MCSLKLKQVYAHDDDDDDDGLCAKWTVYHDEMISLVCCRQAGIKSAKTLMRISYLSVLSGWRAWDNFIVVCRLCHTRESHQWFKEAQSFTVRGAELESQSFVLETSRKFQKQSRPV